MKSIEAARPSSWLRAKRAWVTGVLPIALLLAGCSGKVTPSAEEKKDDTDGKQAGAAEQKPAVFEEEKADAAEKAARQQSKDNLRKLAMAMHDYNDFRGYLPAAGSKGKDGKPLLSWR